MSTVLLKNEDSLLPLDPNKKQSILLLGPDATTPYTGGQGSGAVTTNDALVSPLEAFTAMGLDVEYDSANDTTTAVEKAKKADVVIIFGSAHSGEGHDRDSLNLSGNIDDLIPKVGAVQPKTVVMVTTPGSLLTDWRGSVPSILTNFLPGEQVGNSVADILFGAVSPQGKLPVSFPNKDNEQEMTTKQYPGVQTDDFELQAEYTEGQIVGYRWYDKKEVKPAFGFGHGLSYGDGFEFSNLLIDGRRISFDIKKSAGSAACDTPQVYFGYPGAKADAKIPTKVMRYFEKRCESGTISFEYSDRDVSNWSVEKQAWDITRGEYSLMIGSSSQDIRLTASFSV